MAVHRAESIVLKSWPLHESDLVVSLLTRESGKVKGIAKAALRSRRRFGGALEPMTHVRASYAEKPRQELVRLDSFEIIASPLSTPMDYPRAAALAFYTEVLEESLVERDPQDAIFRLALSVLAQTQIQTQAQARGLSLPVTYFALWMPRLLGWLPTLTRCVQCRQSLRDQSSYYHVEVDGLLCEQHLRPGAKRLQADGLALAERILHEPLPALLAERDNGQDPHLHGAAANLRAFAVLTLERHLEHKLISARALSRLSLGRSAEQRVGRG